MRKSKKLIALSMAALMTAMTGCSGGQTASTQAESAAETQPAGTEAESAGAGEEAAETGNRFRLEEMRLTQQ